MLAIYILIPYFLFALIIFLFTSKYWSKKNHWALNLFYSMTLLLPSIFELLYWILLRKKYNKATKLVLNILNKIDLKYHVVFGTFLFAYRDANFKDTDIDICVYRDEFDEKAVISLKKAGFILSEQWSLDGKISEQTYHHKTMKISMDIFHIGRAGEFAPTFDEINNRYARRPKTFKYTLTEYDVDGIKFKGPKEAEEYLGWNYGIWKKKDPNYHWFHGSSTYPTVVIENAKIEYKKLD